MTGFLDMLRRCVDGRAKQVAYEVFPTAAYPEQTLQKVLRGEKPPPAELLGAVLRHGNPEPFLRWVSERLPVTWRFEPRPWDQVAEQALSVLERMAEDARSAREILEYARAMKEREDAQERRRPLKVQARRGERKAS